MTMEGRRKNEGINSILIMMQKGKELKERMKEGINKFPYYIPDMNKGIKVEINFGRKE